jgi:hypothetical protein
MTTKHEDDSFKNMLSNELPRSLLGSAIDWIRDNMQPDQVFDQARLKQFVGNTSSPDEVFSESDLSAWAKENGFTEPEKKPLFTFIPELNR